MMKLINRTKNQVLFTDLNKAISFKDRLLGLIGQKQLPAERAVLFPSCNWIHTFFMSMPIDVIYLDRKMCVTKIEKNLSPWRLPGPVWKANCVIETQAGHLDGKNIEIGDQLNVGH